VAHALDKLKKGLVTGPVVLSISGDQGGTVKLLLRPLVDPEELVRFNVPLHT